MKRTPFYSHHLTAGAKIVPFGGFEMPVQYSGIIDEHKTVRTSVGVFDVSHMGEFIVKGKNALGFLQRLTINDVSKLVPGRAQYSAMCYENGGIVDDLLVYMIADQHFMVVVNAANLDKDFQWMESHRNGDTSIVDASDTTALLAIQGPNSDKVLQQLTPVDLSKIQYYHFISGNVADIPMIISRTGYTGEKGYEIYFDPLHADKVWKALFAAGKEFGISPIGLGARDTLRLEMGYCLYGNDIDQTTNPIEAGLAWITKLNKGDFIGKQAIDKVKTHGVKRKLVGMTMNEKAVPRHGYSIIANGKTVGTVTSGTFSPSLDKGIAMGYITVELADVGTTVLVDVRGKAIPAVIVPLPFRKSNS